MTFTLPVHAQVDHNVPAARAARVLRTCWVPFVPDIRDYHLGSRQSYTRYRKCMPWIARVQCGFLLTLQYHRTQVDARR